MEEKLYELLDEFADLLTLYENQHYVYKISDYLIPYLIKNKHGINAERIFKEEFTRMDFISNLEKCLFKIMKVKAKCRFYKYKTVKSSFATHIADYNGAKEMLSRIIFRLFKSKIDEKALSWTKCVWDRAFLL